MEKGVIESVMPSTAASLHVPEPIYITAGEKEPATVDEKSASKRNSTASASDEDDDFEYPKGFKVAAITIALCLSVFCMALVRLARLTPTRLRMRKRVQIGAPVRTRT